MGSYLTVIGCLIALGVSGLYLAWFALAPRLGTTAELVIAGLMAAVAAGAVVVLRRLYQYKPARRLATFVLLVGVGLPALLFLSFLSGVPFLFSY